MDDFLVYFGLAMADGFHGCPNLAVKIDQFESVRVSKIEGTDTHSGQCMDLSAAGAAESGYGNTGAPKPFLFSLTEKTGIA